MIKLVVFDFDGTLVEETKIVMEIEKNIAEAYNLPKITEKELKEHSRFKLLFKDLKLHWYSLPFFRKIFRNKFEKYFTKLKLYSGWFETIKELERGNIKWGILSSLIVKSPNEHIIRFLKKNNLRNYSFVKHTSLFGKSYSLKKILKESNLSPIEILYVGDKISDIKACRKIGVKCVSVSWGFCTKEKLQKHNSRFMINKPKELLKFI